MPRDLGLTRYRQEGAQVYSKTSCSTGAEPDSPDLQLRIILAASSSTQLSSYIHINLLTTVVNFNSKRNILQIKFAIDYTDSKRKNFSNADIEL